MASVRARRESGCLLIDFRYRGERCREQTMLPDTPVNRDRLERLGRRIEKAIAAGTFDYREFFPDSPRAKAPAEGVTSAGSSRDTSGDAVVVEGTRSTTFSEFSETWFAESRVRWRSRYTKLMRETMDRIFLPVFGERPLTSITRADLLGFRAMLAERRGHGGQKLSAVRINKLMQQLKAILDEGCARLGAPSPMAGIKPLKQKRAAILPFSLEEVNLLVRTVRADYAPYLTVRCFTGLRTGEANGLQWNDIDFDAGLIKVVRTHSRNGDGETKTAASVRDIPMVPQVRDALRMQLASRRNNVPWVFATRSGAPIDEVNFANRVWFPLLRLLDLQRRPPYQMRHTAATLMLASGENPEWVARVLGHSTTEMLFRVYSRYVPNLTRNDGNAFAGLLSQRNAAPESARTGIERLDKDERAALLKLLLQEASKEN